MKNKRLLAGPYLFWSASFVVIPLLVIVYYAFTSDEGTFTFSNLAQITQEITEVCSGAKAKKRKGR